MESGKQYFSLVDGGLSPGFDTAQQAEAWREANLDKIATASPEAPDFGLAVEAAQQYIVDLKKSAWLAMVANGVPKGAASGMGVALAIYPPVKNAIQDFELGGGHAIVATALLKEIVGASKLPQFPWLAGPVLKVFEDALKT